MGGARARRRGRRQGAKRPRRPRVGAGKNRGPRRSSAGALLLLLGVVFAGLAGYGPVELPGPLPEKLREATTVEEIWVDPAALSFDHLPAWADPRWVQALDDTVAGFEPFPISDDEALRTLGSELAAFAFVERLEQLKATRRHGLTVAVSLRRPVACIPAGEDFLLVSRDAVVLPGRWEKPPRCGAGFLPVIGPVADAELFAYALPGDWLVDPAHLAALDVACSMLEHLDDRARDRLGRTRIDAEMAHAASVDEPGVRIHLENKRLALFGREPSTKAPGELPAYMKWRALDQALQRLEQNPAIDWDLVDCRWDQPDLHVVALAEPAAGSSEPIPRGTPRLDGGASRRDSGSGTRRANPDRTGERTGDRNGRRTGGPRVR